ncbi:MAG: hypothetical protein U0270_16790 [Labilithrix sp.]
MIAEANDVAERRFAAEDDPLGELVPREDALPSVELVKASTSSARLLPTSTAGVVLSVVSFYGCRALRRAW